MYFLLNTLIRILLPFPWFLFPILILPVLSVVTSMIPFFSHYYRTLPPASWKRGRRKAAEVEVSPLSSPAPGPGQPPALWAGVSQLLAHGAIQSTEAESHPLWIPTLSTDIAFFAEICTSHSNIYLLKAAVGIRHAWDNLRRSVVPGRLRTGDWSKPQNYNPSKSSTAWSFLGTP